MARGLVNDVSQCGSLGAPRSRYAGSRNSIPPPIQHTFASRRHGKRGAPEFEFQRQWAAWGADKPSANLSPGSSPEDLDYSGSRSRESCGGPVSQCCACPPPPPPDPGCPRQGEEDREWGGDSPASLSQHPRCPPQRAASLASNFNPEEGANRSFAKLFQSDSDKQIAGSPGV